MTDQSNSKKIDIIEIMETLKEMQLPEKMIGWNQVILMVFKDKEGQKNNFEWIICDKEWKIVDGQPETPTLICEDFEEGFIDRILDTYIPTTSAVRTPTGSGAPYKEAAKFNLLYNGFILGYLRTKLSNNRSELIETRKKNEMKDKERDTQKKTEKLKILNDLYKCPNCHENDTKIVTRVRESYFEIIGITLLGLFLLLGSIFLLNEKFLSDVQGIIKFLWIIRIIGVLVGLLMVWEGVTGVQVPFFGQKLFKEKQTLKMKCNKCNHEWSTTTH